MAYLLSKWSKTGLSFLLIFQKRVFARGSRVPEYQVRIDCYFKQSETDNKKLVYTKYLGRYKMQDPLVQLYLQREEITRQLTQYARHSAEDLGVVKALTAKYLPIPPQ